jgi:Caspase domain
VSGVRSALVVANDRYLDPGLRKLRAPGQDAEALVRVLGDQAIGGFQVRIVANQPEHLLRREVAAFFADRRRDDLLVAHFSCHGVKDDSGHLYFATVDTELGNLDTTAIPAEFVNRQMSRSRSRRVVLMLDCCYSGAFARGMMARADPAIDLRDRFEGRGRIVLTASSAMEYAFEDAELSGRRGQPSVFTRALVQGLETGKADRDGDGHVSVDELYDYLYDEVSRKSPKQTPGRWDFEMQGDILIARTPRPRPVPLPVELRQALESSLADVRLAAVEELKRLLGGSHAGFRLAAAAALRTLSRDDSQRVSTAAAAALAADGQGSAVRGPALPEPAPGPSEKPVPSRVPPARAGVPQAAAHAEPAGRRPAAHPTRAPASREPARKPTARHAPIGRRPTVALLAAALLIAVLFGEVRLLGGASETIAVGQRFTAASPWRLIVEGRDCAASVSSYGGVVGAGHGSNYTLQVRASGEFVLDDLTAGCSAAVAAGAGRRVGLPFALERDGDGDGGDSPVFRSPGAFLVEVDGSGCLTRIHHASDGSQVDEFRGTASQEVRQPGDFYVHSDSRCRTKVLPV